MKKYFKKILYCSVFTGLFLFSFNVYADEVAVSSKKTIENPDVNSMVSMELNSYDEKSDSLLDSWNSTGIDLYEALAQTHKNNPTLLSDRAEFLAVKEQLPQAQAGFKPSLNANAGVTYTDTNTEGQNLFTSDGGNTAKSLGITAEQPLFRGGRTLSEIKSANAFIAAKRAQTFANEQEILLQAITAYLDVMLNQASLELTKNNKSLIELELKQAQARFNVGEITRTDVAQAEARLALAGAKLTEVEGDLSNAKSVYQEIIGSQPDVSSMELPAPVFELPETKDKAMRLAELQNLDVIFAENVEIAAQYDVDSTFGELLPQISATGSLGKDYSPSSFVKEQDSLSLGVTATIPLYQSGATRSRLRQVKKVANQRFLEVYEVKNQARREAATNFSLWNSAKAEIDSRKLQVKATSIAREGVHYEAEFGERTTLDVLDANQELLNAQLDLIKSQYNEVVARFSLAKTLGMLTPKNLDLYEDR